MKKVKIGIIGGNGRGLLARYWHHPEAGSEVVAVADTALQSLQHFRKEINNEARLYRDYHDLLACDDIDAVAVATPDSFHSEQVIDALHSGKHVYCEKPMAIKISDCDKMITAARLSNRKLMIGFNMRYMPFVRKMKELVDAGEIGEIKAVWIRHFVGMGSVYYFHSWHGIKENVSSLLLQKGSHDIDVMHYVTGRWTQRVAAFGGLDMFGGNEPNEKNCPECHERATCIESIDGDFYDAERKPERKRCVFRKEITTPDNYVCMMELEGGIKASYTECHFTPDYHRNFTFIGTKGRIENNEIENNVKLWRRDRPGRNDQPALTIDLGSSIEENEMEVGHGGSDALICQAFVNMILNDTEPPVLPIAGRMSVAVGCCAQQSLQNGGKVIEIPAPV
jgi:predicted dehydrogenase